MRDVEIIPISAVGGIAGKTVEVVVDGSGRVLRLPISQVEIWPGRVVLPGWLYRKIRYAITEPKIGSSKPEGKNYETRIKI